MISVLNKQPPMSLSTKTIVESLMELYGESVTTADLKGYAAMNGTTYVTLTRKLEEYKIGRGKWNLTVKQKLEQTFNAPDAKPVSVQNLVPECDPNYVPLGVSLMLNALSSLVFSILLLLQDFLAMVRPSRSSKHVPNSDVSLFVSTLQSKLTKTILLVVSVLLTVKLFFIVGQSSKLLNVELYYF